MSEPSTEPTDPEAAGQGHDWLLPLDISEPIDGQLADLVTMANLGEDFTLSITLDVHGTVISGDLVGRNRWFAEFAASRDGTGSWADLAEMMRDHGTWDQADVEKFRPDYFLHLMNAHRAVGHGARRADGHDVTGFWRGRVGSVDGWSFGYLSEA